MSQSDSDQQLRIWKELAISKQVLMNEAATALKLKDDFSAEQLREAISHAVQRARDADADMAKTREEAAASIDEMQRQARASDKARADAESRREEADRAREAAEQALATGRKDNADALKKAKRQVDEKQRELKAINVALADTPENTIKKLKALKKQKLDESNARKQAEDANRKLRKENKQQKQELESLESLSENTRKLLEAHRELSTWAENVHQKLAGSDVEVDAPPVLDAALMADIEALVTTEDDTEEADTRREAATA